ncbi:hypothetical protein R50073_36610 [Maricurvus nonylphenolicus]|uniref:hypothetical protein n=1 Tax=Maricurvus nonylphenolicus TaxID=1008307 RepID=UPI0036F36177
MKKPTLPIHHGFITSVATFVFVLFSSHLWALEITGTVGLEKRHFNDQESFLNQDDGGLSLKFQAEIRHKWDDNQKVITFVPFYRKDQTDDDRTHGDIRQLDFIAVDDNWEYQLGIGRVFWGVAESSHLVDIINQTDAVENIDGEDKLGQPMVRASYLYGDGAVSLYVLPYFRERTFASAEGRLRPQLPVNTDDAQYESSKEKNHIDYALRLQHTIDEIDIGLSYFDGTSREPDLIPNLINHTLTPYYPQITQLGLDLQFTGEEWLWKLEAINREFKHDRFHAEVAGFEYTIPRFMESYMDLGLLLEYHHDSRGEVAAARLQNDLFLGSRMVFNDLGDTECLLGVYLDQDNNTKSYNIQFSRRFHDVFKLHVEAQLFEDVDKTDPLYDLRNDSYISVEMEYFF